MYNGNKIKELLVERNYTNKQLLEYLGIACNSSLTQITNGNPSVKKLEKIADFFGVSTDVFFVRESKFTKSEGSVDTVKQLEEKVLLLENLIKEKDRNIQLLEQMNSLLSGTLSGQIK